MEQKPEGPYVYQPYGMADIEHWGNNRMYGVGGISILTTVKGLTKAEAEIIVETLKANALVNKDAEGEE